MQILLANPRGFCAGVDRAISIVENALAIYGAPIYVRHEVVHNRYVVDSLRERGAIFIEQISEVPDGAILIFSAHGVSQAVRNEAKSRDLTVFDATCPLVTKVHMEVARASRRGEEAILIGHAGHPEVEGTMGQYSNPKGGMYLVESPEDVQTLHIKDINKLSFMTQTTLSVDDTSDVIDALRSASRKLSGRVKMTSATPRPTVRKPCAHWRNRRKSCWWSARRTPRTPTVWRSWPSVWGNPLT
jgi:4-hydroxy-3-methylbut-2-enyl diphosphate reductase